MLELRIEVVDPPEWEPALYGPGNIPESLITAAAQRPSLTPIPQQPPLPPEMSPGGTTKGTYVPRPIRRVRSGRVARRPPGSYLTPWRNQLNEKRDTG